MSTDREIAQFVAEVGAREPSIESENYLAWRAIFRRSNYFIFNGKFMIVKISRINPPFWGVDRRYIELLNNYEFYLVLLTSSRSGWIFNEVETNDIISRKRWKLRDKDNNYKIHPHSLPDGNWFASPSNLRKKVGLPDRDPPTPVG